MTTNFPTFFVEVRDNAGVVKAYQPLMNVTSVEITEVLDEAGNISVTVPAHDEHARESLAATNTRVRVRVAEGVTRTCIIHDLSLVDGPPQFIATGPDKLYELAYLTCGYDRIYDGHDVKTEIIGATGTNASLLESTGWTQGIVEDFGSASIKFDGESRLRALIMLCEQLGRHLRQGSVEQTLDFGLFGADSGIRIMQAVDFGPAQEGLDDYDISILGAKPQMQEISADIFNRIFPLGKDRFDMRDAQNYQTDLDTPATGAITNATNATPIVITSAGHGLSTSDYVRIVEVEGNTAANGDWQVTVLSVDTYSLGGSVGNGAYTTGGRWDKILPGDIIVIANTGPIGVETIISVGVTAGDDTVTVVSSTGFIVGREIWLGDANDWSVLHEVAIISEIVGNVITIIGTFLNNYAIGIDVIQAPQFYIEDVASQGAHGVREDCPQFGWIGPVDESASFAQQQQAADSLYAAAKAYLKRYKDPYEHYSLPSLIDIPLTLRVGEKVHLKYVGIVGTFGGDVYKQIDSDFYVMSITRTFSANGARNTALEIANVDRPTPDNAALVLFNLDSNRWTGLG
jgi:hypothetical protein